MKAVVQREQPNNREYHRANDPFWTEALDRYLKLRECGTRELTIDLNRLENLIFDGDGPAYKAMDAMVSVREHEGYEGFRGAPRIVCALLELLAHPRGNRPTRS
ncbi:hypothetical protein CA602_11405 [Paraburkholderia hospita]|nr:hypothetical protein CA602_11405 [Paraburkholderia hospita]